MIGQIPHCGSVFGKEVQCGLCIKIQNKFILQLNVANKKIHCMSYTINHRHIIYVCHISKNITSFYVMQINTQVLYLVKEKFLRSFSRNVLFNC